MHPKYFNLVLLDCMSEYNSDETEIFQMTPEWVESDADCWDDIVGKWVLHFKSSNLESSATDSSL